jgi:hypothetical protein
MSTILYILWVWEAFPTAQGSPLPRLPPGSLVPIGNTTALNSEIAPIWMPSAKVRGTSDILYSCLLTISLSVYSAVHLNVPPRGTGRRWQYLQKAKWTMIGIFAPEVVLYTAFHQFYKAIQLQKSLNAIVKERPDGDGVQVCRVQTDKYISSHVSPPTDINMDMNIGLIRFEC